MEPEIKIKNKKQTKPKTTPNADLTLKPKKHLLSSKLVYYIVTVVAVCVLALAFYLYQFYFNKKTDSTVPSEVSDLASKVGKIMFLPEDELPTIATVASPELLRGQTFFIDAKKGDKVLIYKNAKKAILYDPIAHKIITIAPLVVDENGSATNFGSNVNQDANMLQY